MDTPSTKARGKKVVIGLEVICCKEFSMLVTGYQSSKLLVCWHEWRLKEFADLTGLRDVHDIAATRVK